MIKFTEDHEWLNPDGDIVTVGITGHAQEQLGDIVFVELPEIGTRVSKGDEVVVIESVKAASDIASPVDGEIVEINEAIVETPGMVNEDAEGEGWFFKVRTDNADQLDEYMDDTATRT